MKTVIDHIMYYENAVDNRLCNSVIEHYTKNANWGESKFATHTGISQKTKERVKMDEVWIAQEDPFYNELNSSFTKVVRKYCEKFPRIVPERLTPFRLNHYSEGGFMSKHIDNIHHSHGQKYGFPHITALLFLNDDYEGGQFELCSGDFVPDITQGSCVTFPSNFMYPHEVKKVESGSRFSLMTWVI